LDINNEEYATPLAALPFKDLFESCYFYDEGTCNEDRTKTVRLFCKKYYGDCNIRNFLLIDDDEDNMTANKYNCIQIPRYMAWGWRNEELYKNHLDASNAFLEQLIVKADKFFNKK
jgi:hypothetical protein